ncbi:MAG TPA: YuzB family protein [Paenibacillaceae bacterium]
MHIIEYCASNLAHGTGDILRRLAEMPGVEVMEYDCLDHCGDCALFPYVLVNGEMVAAATAEELHEKVLEAIRQQEDEQAALDRLLDDL